MATQIFATKHTDNSAIRVLYGRDTGEQGLGLDVVLNGQIVGRFYNPAEVTKWFEGWSKANVTKWQNAYHTSGLNADSFQRPLSQGDVILKVPYLSQRDNERYPLGTCNVTCYAMVMGFYGIKRKKDSFRQLEDELSKFLESFGRDRHVHDDLVWMAEQYGLDASFRTDRTLDQIRAEIRSGHPVIVSTQLTSAGHIICLIGTQGEDFIVHDPFGNYLTKYKDPNGKALLYSGKLMQAKIRNADSDSKWAHFVRKP
jgi:hypothetical protein